MPVSSSIYQAIQTPEPANQLDSLLRGLKAQELGQGLQLNGLKMDEYKRGVERTNRLNQLLQGDYENEDARAGALVKGGFLKEGTEYQKSVAERRTAQADLRAKLTKLQADKIAMHRDQLAGINDAESAVQWLRAGYDDPDTGPIMSKLAPFEQAASRIPTDPEGFAQWKQQAALGATKFIETNKPTFTTRSTGQFTETLGTEGLTGKTRVLNRVQNTQSPDSVASVAASIDNNKRTVAAQLANAGATREVANATRDAARIQTGFKNEQSLREEFNGLPEIKRYKAAIPSWRAIESAAKTNNPQADINLIYGLAKLYDPESVVREGEYGTIANSQAIPEWIKGMAQRLAGGGRLTTETKRQVLEQALGRIGTYRSEHDKTRASYADIAKKRGMSLEDVLPAMGDAQAGAPAAAKVLRFDAQGNPIP